MLPMSCLFERLNHNPWHSVIHSACFFISLDNDHSNVRQIYIDIVDFIILVILAFDIGIEYLLLRNWLIFFRLGIGCYLWIYSTHAFGWDCLFKYFNGFIEDIQLFIVEYWKFELVFRASWALGFYYQYVLSHRSVSDYTLFDECVVYCV